jgi:hypothetical protein
VAFFAKAAHAAGKIIEQSQEVHGTHLPKSFYGASKTLLDAEALSALSALLANVNKRGFWQ